MKRKLLSAVAVLGLAIGGSFAFDAVTGVAPAEAAKQKVCKAKTPEGKTKSWRCGANQACCTNKAMGLYVCGYPGLGCL